MDDLHLYLPIQDGGTEPADSEIFGAAANDFWILEGGRIPWSAHAEELDVLFGGPSRDLLIHFQPWWPGVETKRRVFRAGIKGVIRDVNGALLAVVSPGSAIETVLTTRNACGGANSGLWLLISPRDNMNELSARLIEEAGFGSPLRIALSLIDHVSVALALDEGAWGTLLVRRDHLARNALRDLMSKLRIDDSSAGTPSVL